MYVLGTDHQNRCSECGRIRHRTYRINNKMKISKQEISHKRFRRYGLTPQSYDEMLESQEGKCAICGCFPKEDSLKRTFHIDHCHSTGRVRGLLCRDCNTMLGFAKDNIETLRGAMEYLS